MARSTHCWTAELITSTRSSTSTQGSKKTSRSKKKKKNSSEVSSTAAFLAGGEGGNAGEEGRPGSGIWIESATEAPPGDVPSPAAESRRAHQTAGTPPGTAISDRVPPGP